MKHSLQRLAVASSVMLGGLTIATPESSDPAVERGRHLVENVALCADCHTPRLATGELDRSRWLKGAPVGFHPLNPMPWAPAAPGIAGLPGRTDADVVALLTHGMRPDGSAPLPPMPSFRMTPEEARAVVAYLRSLTPLTEN